MSDCYQILGVNRAATQQEIRAAYKKLAMQYHPDRNPHNPMAEEMFKQINEAYHVLSDPLKKSRYDQRHAFSETHYTPPRDHRPHTQTHRRPAPPKQRRYQIDKNYFKIQGLAILTFLVIASIVFGIARTVSYFVEKEQLEKFLANTKMLQQANGLFGAGRYGEAFDALDKFKIHDPLEFRFIAAKDSLMLTLEHMGEAQYRKGNYANAIQHFLVLKAYQVPVKKETLRYVAQCQYYLKNYPEALQALKQLHNQNPSDLTLIYQIGMINLEGTHHYYEALQYFSLGKDLFKQNLTAVYGKAFELVMDPEDAPDIYYQIFIGRGRTNLKLEHYAEAITDGRWATFLRRTRPEGFVIMALSRAKSGNRSEACEDLSVAKRMGSAEAEELSATYCH